MNDRTALWLYGSYARGDADTSSDLDLLIVSDEPNAVDAESDQLARILKAGKIALSEEDGVLALSEVIAKHSTSFYEWHEIEEMSTYGSLFLQHLRLEGRSLWEGRYVEGKLQQIFSNLPRYQRSARDLLS